MKMKASIYLDDSKYSIIINHNAMETLMSWFSIPSLDFDRAVKFYEEILDISMEKMGEWDERMASIRPMSEPGVNGGVSGDSSFRPSKDGVRIYINVAGELDAVLGRVQSAGGEILTPKTSIGEHGFYGLIKDTEGNHIGLHSL